MGIFILVCVGIGVLFLLIVMATAKKKPKPINIFDQYSPNGKIWMQKLFDFYKTGETWEVSPNNTYDNYEKMFNVTLDKNKFGTKVEAYRKDLGIVNDYLSIEDEKNIEFQKGDFEFWLNTNLTMRWHRQYRPLTGQNAAAVMAEYNLNIHANEVLYFSSKKIDWYEEKTTSSNTTYSGYRFRSGGKMSFSTGSFHVVRNSVTDFVALDRGSLYITNKRIIFICESKAENRSINIEDLLEFSMYKDGVLLGKANSKKPLILVPDYVGVLVPRDDLNTIVRILYRVMSGTENLDLIPVSA